MNEDQDNAPAGGIPRFGPGKRPLLRVTKGGQEMPKSTRPILPAGRQRPTIDFRGNYPSAGSQRPTIDFRGNYSQMDNNVDNAPAKGIERPKLTLKTMDDIYGTPSKQKPGAPFDQDLEPDEPDDPWAD